MNGQWTIDSMPDMTGKRVIITGGSGGLGLETAYGFAQKGAKVIMAVRNMEKGYQAAEGLMKKFPQASVEVMRMDLADLSSIEAFAAGVIGKYNELHVLVNNAGVMIPPYRKTKDGFELQFGSNHLGHFALTGRLLPLLLKTPGSRIVTLSSIAAKSGYIYFNNLDGRIGYSALKFYGQSKLANLLFARELQKRLTVAGADTISVACHPGVSNTNLISRGSGKQAGKAVALLWGLMSQSAAMGALPTLYAAAEPGLQGGEYIGPTGKGGRKGYPGFDLSAEHKMNEETMAKLWRVSEELTGVNYDFSAASEAAERKGILYGVKL
ncbi:oxidoreductase [Saccharibacillus alkalitolerans]|uniref:SDR family NAD(P)-dependent oxidoreductase n=1 Tax=Saccharibacillus alkalitolerans TaxID=2705290 RepID=A0ABX0F8E9_9BACL|nr:oxidoreductase [Saccharibacillus alkalitolerans]NGZ76715.1 SDR family NAD(P)-dependent oxidoreductase [Saccharibacillus alkalitolerans]